MILLLLLSVFLKQGLIKDTILVPEGLIEFVLTIKKFIQELNDMLAC